MYKATSSRKKSVLGIDFTLHQAPVAMKAKYPDPFDWGALICQGNPSPLVPVELKEVRAQVLVG
jgi:hypothetical protein